MPDAAAQGYVTLLDQVYRSGEAYAAHGAKYAVQGKPCGPANERHIDFVFQPIRDARGALTRILVQGLDATERVLTEIRRSALVRFTESVREFRTPDEIFLDASVILGETLGVSRAGYGTIDPEAETLTITRDWNAHRVESLAGTLNLRDYSSFIDDLKLGKFIAIDDIERDPRTSGATSALQARSAASFVNVPVRENDRLVAVAFVNLAGPGLDSTGGHGSDPRRSA